MEEVSYVSHLLEFSFFKCGYVCISMGERAGGSGSMKIDDDCQRNQFSPKENLGIVCCIEVSLGTAGKSWLGASPSSKKNYHSKGRKKIYKTAPFS